MAVELNTKLESFKSLDYMKNGEAYNVYDNVKDFEWLAYIKENESDSIVYEYFYFYDEKYKNFYGLLLEKKVIGTKFNWKRFEFEKQYKVTFRYNEIDIRKAIDFIFKFDKEIAKKLSKRFVVN
jgi:hypothetical protein